MIDNQLDQIANRLSEIAISLVADKEILEAKKNQQEAQNKYDESRLALHRLEDLVSSVRIKIETNESSMYSGKIQSPKELQDLQNENAALKRQVLSLEDEQLEAMMAQDQAKEQLQVASDNLIRAEADSINLKSGFLGEQTRLVSQKDALQIERGAIAGSILAENLSIYQRLREKKRGVAVSLVSHNACSICGAALRPAELQEASSPRQMAYCTTCGRILFSG